MDGERHMATKFASSLRRHLFKLHLGLLPPQPCTHESQVTTGAHQLGTPQDVYEKYDDLVMDPVGEDFQKLWKDTARQNLEHFQNVFHCTPSNQVETWEQYSDYVAKPPVKVGHVYDPEMDPEYVKKELDSIKGAPAFRFVCLFAR